MTDKLIQTPIAIWGNPYTGQSEQKLIEAINNSLAPVTLTHGDVVILDVALGGLVGAGGWGLLVGSSASAKSPYVIGVISVTGDATTSAAQIPAGGICQVVIGGVARVNIGAQACAAGNAMQNSAIRGQALGNAALVAADSGTIFGIALEAAAAKDVNNTIRCLIKSA